MTNATSNNYSDKDRITLSIGVISIYAAAIVSLLVFIKPEGNLMQQILYTVLVVWMGGGAVSLFLFLILSLLHLKYRDKDMLSYDFPFPLSERVRQFFFDLGAEHIALSFIYGIAYIPFFYLKNFIGIIISAVIIGSISFLARMSSRGR